MADLRPPTDQTIEAYRESAHFWQLACAKKDETIFRQNKKIEKLLLLAMKLQDENSRLLRGAKDSIASKSSFSIFLFCRKIVSSFLAHANCQK